MVTSALIFMRSRHQKVDRHNVNDDWDEGTTTVAPGDSLRSGAQEVTRP